MRKITSTEIKKKLSEKYRPYIWFEVNTGPTPCLRLDGLKLEPSWVRPGLTGFEIKVNENDFKRDEKFHEYKKFCHKLFIVCPKDMISIEQVEDRDTTTGLLYYHPKYKKNCLYTKKAAIYRDIGPPDPLVLYYILMAKADPDIYPFHNDQAEYFRDWVSGKKHNKELGQEVGSRIVKTISEQEKRLLRLQTELEKYENIRDGLDKVQEYLKKKGIMKGDFLGDNCELYYDWREKISEALDASLTLSDRFKLREIINGADGLKYLLEDD